MVVRKCVVWMGLSPLLTASMPDNGMAQSKLYTNKNTWWTTCSQANGYDALTNGAEMVKCCETMAPRARDSNRVATRWDSVLFLLCGLRQWVDGRGITKKICDSLRRNPKVARYLLDTEVYRPGTHRHLQLDLKKDTRKKGKGRQRALRVTQTFLNFTKISQISRKLPKLHETSKVGPKFWRR